MRGIAIMPSGRVKGSEEAAVTDERPEDDETASSDVGETVEETAAASGEEESYRAPEFRPAYMDDNRAGEAAPPPPGDAFFVTVNGSDGAVIHRFDDPAKAKAFVERLLDEGIGEGEVTAFAARKLTLHVSHRPVVTLLTNEG
jgi:hypothetical protein